MTKPKPFGFGFEYREKAKAHAGQRDSNPLAGYRVIIREIEDWSRGSFGGHTKELPWPQTNVLRSQSHQQLQSF
ncbi:hypothetical protein LJR235_002168 [Pararhizobium sp. LjRoot235]|uniref:hypothetical protein n=1 Tax=Pararhizobium sp. LjRoot235 TaxID=3342291 RepID=UPI003ECCC2E2